MRAAPERCFVANRPVWTVLFLAGSSAAGGPGRPKPLRRRGAVHQSSASGSHDCVEVALAADAALVRHSRNIAGTPLCFSSAAWAAFLGSLRH
ncbi:DUF397 domain-containing protein [Saccharothrix xinjiangensis]|uniref:DUF397 domain-containing protein n=1 Tax=Saccharothrix xinjiangensis TaxID=204798 RepID=A0ABV9YEV6_9PSEU